MQPWSCYSSFVVCVKGGAVFNVVLLVMLLQMRWVFHISSALCLALFRVSGSLWHSSKYACWFKCVLQSSSVLEVFACSIGTSFNNYGYYSPTVSFFWLSFDRVPLQQLMTGFWGDGVGERGLLKVQLFKSFSKAKSAVFKNLFT